MHCRLNFQLAETIVVLVLEILDHLSFKHSLDIIKQIRPNKILVWNLHSLFLLRLLKSLRKLSSENLIAVWSFSKKFKIKNNFQSPLLYLILVCIPYLDLGFAIQTQNDEHLPT